MGAGKGDEVLALRRHFRNIVAIEPDYHNVSDEAKPYVKLGDATAMNFPNDSFDIIYCFHVLEHIPQYNKSLSEIHRVLRRGGVLYLGVPNKSRLFSYIFIKGTPIKKKILWNINDYVARMKGKFENCFGAHAGFTRKELQGVLEYFFPILHDATDRYYLIKYGNRIVIRLITSTPVLKNILWPSVYFTCQK